MKEKKYLLDDNISLIKRHRILIRNTRWIRDFFHEKMGIVFDNKKAYMESFMDIDGHKIYRLSFPGKLGRWSIALVFEPKYPFYGFVYEIVLYIHLCTRDGITMIFGEFHNYASLLDVETDVDFATSDCRRTLTKFIGRCFKCGRLNKEQDEKLQRLLLEIL